jgi:hypothetical protein
MMAEWRKGKEAGKATVERVHHIVVTLAIDMSEKKVVDEIIAEDSIMIVIIAVVMMILKAEKEARYRRSEDTRQETRYQRDEPSSGDRKRRT